MKLLFDVLSFISLCMPVLITLCSLPTAAAFPSVVAWGDPDQGGNTTAVAEQLDSSQPAIQTIFHTWQAFAALRVDSSVVTWGNPERGGDSSTVADELLANVSYIASANAGAFAALKTDGSVVTWGDPRYGGDSSEVETELLSDVIEINSTRTAFAALKADGSVVTWGNPGGGGNSSTVAEQLSSGVVNIFSATGAFAALKNDGSVVTWGGSDLGGDSSSIQPLLTNVVFIEGNERAFAALKEDGSVVSWGDPNSGGDSSAVAADLTSDVLKLFSNSYAFAALKRGGKVISWGDSSFSNMGDAASELQQGVQTIVSNEHAFAAIKGCGRLVVWGAYHRGGDSTPVAEYLEYGVYKVVPSDFGYVAIRKGGQLLSWGQFLDSAYQGQSLPHSFVTYGARDAFASAFDYSAILENGTVITWPAGSRYGGNSSAVADQLQFGVTRIYSNFHAFAAVKEPDLAYMGEPCHVQPMSLSSDRYFSDPWDRNLGCRYDVNSACVPAGTSPEDADAACLAWVERNCGCPKGGYWEAYAEPDGSCRIHLRTSESNSIDYYPFPGLLPSDELQPLLPDNGLFQGCRVNFLLHPPAHDDVHDGPAGCEWFITAACPGLSLDDFSVAVSGKADPSGHSVCAMVRSSEVCGVFAMDLEANRYSSDPWERNLGCRLDINSACFPSGASQEEADTACQEWTQRNCMWESPGHYWEVYATTSSCKINLRKEGGGATHYIPYTGMLPGEASEHMLPNDGTYQGCRINFTLHPPVHDGSGAGAEGCQWFIDEYCEGLGVDDFNIAVSVNDDLNSNRVCALKRRS